MVENIKIEDIEKNLLNIHDFGVTYKGSYSLFKVWAPYSDNVKVAIYKTYDDYRRREYAMVKDSDGVWSLRIELDLKDQFYNYIVINHGQSYEIVDPYAKAATANSKRAMIIDMEETNPEGWLEHPVPMPVAPCSSLLYEAHY